MSFAQVRKALTEEKVTFGTRETLKNMKRGKVKKIFLASNCPAEVRESVEAYKKLAKVEVVQLEEPSDELMLICKKNFPVTVLSC
ncbi:MAG: ribosomal L7Ae/L30e/S12e/Gadd45 family protein [Nanoarchaeota archaeon]